MSEDKLVFNEDRTLAYLGGKTFKVSDVIIAQYRDVQHQYGLSSLVEPESTFCGDIITTIKDLKGNILMHKREANSSVTTYYKLN